MDNHGEDNIFLEVLGEAGPNLQKTIERNFPANIITLIDTWNGDFDTIPEFHQRLRKQAELAILQIDRHNAELHFDSVSVIRGYNQGEGRIK